MIELPHAMNRVEPTYRSSASNATISAVIARFAFAGKEKDPETGLSYFGARFYDADRTTGWLSVDPMSDKYPSMSPYNYCMGNPVKLVDEEGAFPRFPFWLRATFAKQVRQAVVYKMKNGGDLSIWESRRGCVFASVSASTNTKNSVTISEKMFRPEGYTNEAQIRATTDFFVIAETWMDEPATSIGDFALKTVSDIAYSLVNEPTKVLTGYSLAGIETTSQEKSEAFIETASSGLGSFLSKGMETIKTIGRTGLQKYYDFVRKSGNYQGRTKNEMGRLYQNNKNLNEAIGTIDIFQNGINKVSALKKE
ncbi:MAG: RHS repeat-associated core domain-containing protein [Bacteroidales bacterium]|nr:RHS repeat-associated core domain-containing protein [Bacteroidales bacterium]